MNTELIKLSNCKHLSDTANKEFENFILNHIQEFDDESWNILFCSIDITIKGMKENIGFWESIYPILENIDIEKFNDISKMILNNLKNTYQKIT